MRRPSFLLAVLCCFMAGAAWAQSGAAQGIGVARERARIDAAATQLAHELGLGDAHQLVHRASHTDGFGQTHSRFQQYYKGLRVDGGEILTHRDDSGEVAPRGGALVGNMQLAVTPAIDRAQALAAAGADGNSEVELLVHTWRDAMPAKGPAINAAQQQRRPGRARLAWQVRHRLVVAGEPQQWMTLVDAHSGLVLARWNDLHTAAAKGSGQSQYSGSVTLDTDSTASGFALRDTTRGTGGKYGGNAVVNMNHASSGDGSIFTDADNAWGDGKDYVPGAGVANGQTSAVDAAYGVQASWDYFKNVFQRNGVDDKGTATFVRVHYRSGYSNAFWDDGCFCMTYGDGDGGVTFKAPLSINTVGHELAHGVTTATANLSYLTESGGLNEANSDIHGTLVEFYARGANGRGSVIPDVGGNWTFGEQDSGSNMRYMYKPSLDGKSPDSWSPSLYKLDVHYSSGPMNRAFYFLSQGALADSASDYYSPYLPAGMTGIGNDKAARIWYRAMASYMTSTSDYLAARAAALRAAIDLHGAGSAENVAVRKAFGAINVGSADSTVDDFVAPAVAASFVGSSGQVQLAATASDNVGVVRVDFFIDAVPVGTASASPYRLALDSAQFANGSHALTAIAYDAAGNFAESASTAIAFTNDNEKLLKDPGFEAGGLGWRYLVPVFEDYETSVAVRSGHFFASFGGYLVNGKLVPQVMCQVVALPADKAALVLSLWLRIASDERTRAVDSFKVELRSTGHEVLATLATYSNVDARNDYVRRQLDLTAYRGQTVEVCFNATIADLATGTDFFIDDLALVALRNVPVLVQPSVAWTTMVVGETRQFGATVTGAPDQRVTWSVLEGAAGGSVSASGLYSAPAVLGDYHLIATSTADPGASAAISLKVTAADGSRIAVVPGGITLPPGGQHQFSAAMADAADTRLRWSVGSSELGASVSASGLYTAPTVHGQHLLSVFSVSERIHGHTMVTVASPLRYTVQLAAGWNLVGNSTTGSIDVAATLGDAGKFASVWKWDARAAQWHYYAPALAANGTLAKVAAANGYAVLTAIGPGEGYWIEVPAAAGNISMPEVVSFGIDTTSLMFAHGWNLVATGYDLGAADFNRMLAGATSGTPGITTTIWAWDNASSSWYFYAPDKDGDGSLPAYAASKGYQPFGAVSLGKGRGFWVYYPFY